MTKLGKAEEGEGPHVYSMRCHAPGTCHLTSQLLLGMFPDEETAAQKVNSRCPRLAGSRVAQTWAGSFPTQQHEPA